MYVSTIHVTYDACMGHHMVLNLKVIVVNSPRTVLVSSAASCALFVYYLAEDQVLCEFAFEFLHCGLTPLPYHW